VDVDAATAVFDACAADGVDEVVEEI